MSLTTIRREFGKPVGHTTRHCHVCKTETEHELREAPHPGSPHIPHCCNEPEHKKIRARGGLQ